MADNRKTVVVIGAGIVGVSTAIWLQRDGHAVTLIDRAGPAEGTSFGNGGVLASCAVVPVPVPGLMAKAPRMLLDPDQPLFLKWRYLPRLLPWLARYLRRANAADAAAAAAALTALIGDSLADHQALATGTGAEKWLVPSDYLFVYEKRAQFEADAFGWGLRRDLGFEWTELGQDAFRAYDPVFDPRLGFAIKLADHGRISDPGQYVKALARHFEQAGGRLLISDATGIRRDSGAVAGVQVSGQEVPCDTVVLATGVWSGPLARQLGLKVPLESERGYHIEFWDPSFVPRSPVMVTSGKFVATPMEGRLRLAGVVEFGGLDAAPSRAPVELLKRQGLATFPGLQYSKITEWLGHRPATDDAIPVIGPVPGIAGAYAGFGHHHVGLTGGPKTGRLLAQMIAGRQPNIDMTPFSAARYTGG